MERFRYLTNAFAKLLNIEPRPVMLGSLEEAAKVCGGSPCIIRIEAGDTVYELLVYDGKVRAARGVKGEQVVFGEDVAREAAGRLPGVAGVLVLPERLLEWRDEDFTVYIRGIDLQHKQLVRIFNNLYRAMLEGSSRYAYDALNFLREYTVFHFKTEERLFEKYGYPKAEEHREQHAYFVKQVEDFATRLKSVGEEAASLDMLGFLAHWIKAHIQGADREYGKWFREKGIQVRLV